MENQKEQIIRQILEIEYNMFQRVPTGDDEPSCRAFPDEMRMHRRSQFSVWSVETCTSYLEDLKRAEQQNVNLMTIKYARMDNLIPVYSQNPLIEKICVQYELWQKEMFERYPQTMRGARSLKGFRDYLQAELETYSGKTLELLYQDVVQHVSEKKNMSEEVYEYLVRRAGKKSLLDYEHELQG